MPPQVNGTGRPSFFSCIAMEMSSRLRLNLRLYYLDIIVRSIVDRQKKSWIGAIAISLRSTFISKLLSPSTFKLIEISGKVSFGQVLKHEKVGKNVSRRRISSLLLKVHGSDRRYLETFPMTLPSSNLELPIGHDGRWKLIKLSSPSFFKESRS